MVPFSYLAAKSPKEAIDDHVSHPDSKFLGGGTNLLDHLKLNVENPRRLIDVRKVGLDKIEDLPGGGLRIGAAVSNSDAAYDSRVKKHYPVLSTAILSGASPQLRNMATTAGNLLQRTRCYYFRDTASPCNKREPGSGCSAIGGINRIHAILGTSERCIATHPSDMDVALMALDALIRVGGPKGERAIPISEFYIAYGEDPARENVLDPAELILSVDLPPTPWFARSHYIKARDRASYEFALSSAAVALEIHNGKIRDCRVALGGVGTKPWRALATEAALRGAEPTPEIFDRAARAELADAKPQKDNAFKVELCRRVLVGTLKHVAEMRG